MSVWDLFEKNSKYRFHDTGLLIEALTHRSSSRSSNNQRLEFLGDAVLGLISAEELFNESPELSEGEMTVIRAARVNKKSLVVMAEKINLYEMLMTGPGQSRKSDGMMADAMEAVIGAVYLDGGYQCALTLVKNLTEPVDPAESSLDPKTELQQYTQGEVMGIPLYTYSDPDLSGMFDCRVVVYGETIVGIGNGRTKKEASKNAAQAALEYKHVWTSIVKRVSL